VERRENRYVDFIIYSDDVFDFWKTASFRSESYLGNLQNFCITDYAANRSGAVSLIWPDQAGTSVAADHRIDFLVNGS